MMPNRFLDGRDNRIYPRNLVVKTRRGAVRDDRGVVMSTLPVMNTLTSLFVPIGWAGAVFAIVCALIALVALARGAAGLTGGAVGVWFVGGLLSLTSSFAGQWVPVLLASGALAAALVVGGMIRMLTLPAAHSAATVAVPVETGPVVQAVPPISVRTATVKTQPVKTSPVAASHATA